MKKYLLVTLLFLSIKTFAQPGPASMQPSNFIKDATERTVTMKNGDMKNTPVNSHWQLHGTGFQPMISLGAGGFYLETSPENAAFSYVTQNAGNIPSASMMAPIDLPHNADIQSFEACYHDRSGLTNFPDCSLKFTFYRVLDNGCPPEVLGAIVSLNSGQLAACPIRCTALTPATNPNLTVDNKEYFYYVIVSSFDDDGSNGNANCGNWTTANLGVRGIQIEYKQK